jgi:hypothetical protein
VKTEPTAEKAGTWVLFPVKLATKNIQWKCTSIEYKGRLKPLLLNLEADHGPKRRQNIKEEKTSI